MKPPALPVLACFLLATAASAEPACPASYAQGTAPSIANEKMAAKTQEICYEGYATMFSGVTRTPLWSADHLTQDRVKQACTLSRRDAFHPDPNLPAGIRSELSDYQRSGYDRGHMAPSADMPAADAQKESFSLANMAPQVHEDNAGIWEHLENGARNEALAGHEVYVVSGPLFEGAELKQLKGRVMVPTGFYKAIYDASVNRAGVYLTPNTAEQTFTLISVADLAQRTGIDAFPDLPARVKAAASPVITPAERTACPRRGR